MLTSLTYANADGTRTAIVERCDSGDALFLWSVTCRDYGQSDHCLTGYLHFCQRIARRWVQQGHPPAGAAPGGRAVSPAHGGRTMMTEQRLQEIDEGNVPEQRAIDECVTEIRRLRAEVEQAQQERDEAMQRADAACEAGVAQIARYGHHDRNDAVLASLRAMPTPTVYLSEHPLAQQTYDLVRAIDGLPASLVATALVDEAGALFDLIKRYIAAQRPSTLVPCCSTPYCEHCAGTGQALATATAQPPVLPPLPDKWQRQEYDSESVTFLNGPDFYFDAFASGVVMHIDDCFDDCFTERINVADLLIVLRHAEAAHLTLKEGK